MSGSKQIPWEADPHTKAKHALYTQYLSKWMPIMIRGWGANITYAEGFAGPGVYLDGSPGSPVIALKTLVSDPDIRTLVQQGGIRFVFVDHDQRCVDTLSGELAKAAKPVPLDRLGHYGIHLRVEKGECESDLGRLLARENAWERPMLAVLDTWGGAVSYDLVRSIADNPSSEVIITMQPQYFSRFAKADEVTHGDRVFGSRDWREVDAQPPENKDRWLLQRYRDTVKSAGFSHVLDFELIDQRGHSLFLVFGTTHKKGLIKMKEAMWEVDDVAGVGYRDPRDPHQQTLAIELEPNTAPLRRLIADHLRTQPDQRSPILELREFALYNTVFKESQVMPVVREMIARNELTRAASAVTSARLSFNEIVAMQSAP